MTGLRVWLSWACVTLCLCSGAFAVEGMDAQTQRLWDRHWRVYAQNCAEFEGEYLCSPAYQKRLPSSAGMTVRQAEAKLSEKVRFGGSGVVVTKTVKLPRQEAEAMALPIPKIKAGEYGYLASVEVVQVLGPKSAIVKDLYLIDPVAMRRDYRADRAKAKQAQDRDAAEASLEYIYTHRDALLVRQKDKKFRKIVMRLEGFATDGMTEDERWAGPKDEGLQVLIVRPEVYGSQRRERKRLVGVSVEKVRWGLDEAGFIRLLEARGMEPAGFVELVMERMAEDKPDVATARVFNALLPRLADRVEDDEADTETKSEDDNGADADKTVPSGG